MKISIIVPVHNEDEHVGECLDALIKQDYPRENYEIIAVDDGSTDNTFEVLSDKQRDAETKGIFLRTIKLENREGRALARENAAKEAKYDNLLFVDSRVIPDTQLLKRLKKLNYQPVLGNAVMTPDRSIYDHFFCLIRRKLYHPYYGEEFPHVYITEENFNLKIPKGTGAFLCDKKLFFEAMKQVNNKFRLDISDDTKLLYNIVKMKEILKHSDPRVYYKTRLGLKNNLIHIFRRGLKFSDFYLSSGGPLYKYFIIGLLLIYLIMLPLLFFPEMILLALVSVFIVFEICLTKIFCKSWKDIRVFVPHSMLLGCTFTLGILKSKIKELALVISLVVTSWLVILKVILV